MKVAIVVGFLLLAGCSSPTAEDTRAYGFLTALEALPYALQAANETLQNPELIILQGEDVSNSPGTQAPQEMMDQLLLADGRAHAWSFGFNGDNESATVHVMLSQQGGEPNLQVDPVVSRFTGEALDDWSMDSDEATQIALADGLNASVEFLLLDLIDNDGPVWVASTRVGNEQRDFRIIDAESGELRQSLTNATIQLPVQFPEGGSDSVAAAGSGIGSIAFDVTIESSQLVFNYTRTGTNVYALATATLTHPDGNVSTGGHNPAQLGADFQFLIDNPPVGTYTFNVTGSAGFPAFDIIWCALGYDPNSDTEIWC